MEISALGGIIALIVAIALIFLKIEATYAMMAGALVGGIIGGGGLEGTTSMMIDGVSSMSGTIARVVASGVLAGVLIESGGAETIAKSIIKNLGPNRSLFALTLSTWALVCVGVFGDVAILTVAPIAIAIGWQGGFGKMGVLIALVGGSKAGNLMSPNPNTIAVAESYGVPLSSVIIGGIPCGIAALIVAYIISKHLSYRGSKFSNRYTIKENERQLPTLSASLVGPIVAIALLIMGPLFSINIDPLIALPLGGLVGLIAMGETGSLRKYLSLGLNKMSGVVMLLIATGTLAGVLSKSYLNYLLVDLIGFLGLPGYLLAPISGIFMGGLTASSTAGAMLASSIFSPIVLETGLSPLAGAVMTHSGAFVLNTLPQGSFFHVSGGAIGMEMRERLKLIGWEALIGLAMVIVSIIIYGLMA